MEAECKGYIFYNGSKYYFKDYDELKNVYATVVTGYLLNKLDSNYKKTKEDFEDEQLNDGRNGYSDSGISDCGGGTLHCGTDYCDL